MFFSSLCLFLLVSIFVFGADFNVTNTADSGLGSLRKALQDASAAGTGPHRILFSSSLSGTISLGSNLPLIESTISHITGPTAGSVTIDGMSGFQVFFVKPNATLSISNLSITNALSQGGQGGSGYSGGGGALGAGGALFVGASSNITVQGVSFTNCSSQGGDGGEGSSDALITAGGGGGGFLKGDGAAASSLAIFNLGGGGGGGLNGSGGGGRAGGGGGGGLLTLGGVGPSPLSATSVGSGGGGGGFSGAGIDGTLASGGNGGLGIGSAPGGDGGASDGDPGGDGSSGSGGGGGASRTLGNGGKGGNGSSPGGAGGGGGSSIVNALTALGGAGGDGGLYAGGGGGGGALVELLGTQATAGAGGSGGDFAGGGGGGGASVIGISVTVAGGVGGTAGFAGGGGGGGRGGTNSVSGGAAGFGGGGGGAGGSSGTGGTGGFGGGSGGGGSTRGGGAGAALGGAIFVDETSTLRLLGSGSNLGFTGNQVVAGTAGTGGGSASAIGKDLFLVSGSTTEFNFTGTLTLSQAIGSDQGAGGGSGGGIIKQGSGSLVLSGVNLMTGSISIAGGEIVISADSGLGNSSNGVSISSGAKLRMTAPMSSNRAISLGSGGGVLQTDAAVTWGGVIGQTVAAALTKTGSGSLTLSGVNTYSGGTTLAQGTLIVGSDTHLGNSAGGLTFSGGSLEALATFSTARDINLSSTGTFIVDSSVTLTASGDITGAASLVKTGAGTLILSGSNQYLGTTTISQGTLQGNVAALPSSIVNQGTLIFDQGSDATFSKTISGGGSFVKTNSGALSLTAVNSYVGTTINGGTIKIAANENLGSLAGSLTLNGGALQTTASFSMARDISLAGAGNLIVDDATTLTLSSNISGAGNLKKSGLGTLILSGTSSYTGGTQIDGGILQIGDADDLGTGGSLVFNGGSLAVTNSFTMTRNVTLTGDGGLDIPATKELTISGIISDSGALIKKGAGRLILSGVNTYSGGTEFAEGEVRVANNSQLGDATGTLTFSGGTLEVTSTFSANRATTVGSSGTVDITGGATFTLSGQVLATGSFTKKGAGTLILTGANSLGSGIDLTQGVLQGSSTSLTGNIANEGSLIFDQGANGVYSGVISGSGSVTKNNSGRLTLTRVNTYSGGTTLNAGTLAISKEENLGSVASSLTFNGGTLQTTADLSVTKSFVFSSDGTLQVNPSSTMTMQGVISGAGGLIKTGGGELKLTATNSYSGATTINQGKLTISDTTNLGNLSQGITFNGATLEAAQSLNLARTLTLTGNGQVSALTGVNFTLSSDISGAGNLIKEGAGKVILSGAKTYTGNTRFNEGTLSVAADNSLGSGGALIFNGGTLEVTTGFSSTRSAQLPGEGIFRVTSGETLTMQGVISGAGQLTKTGPGTLVLSGLNTFGGGLEFQAGTLSVASNAPLGGASGSLTFTGGTLNSTANFSSARDISCTASAVIDTDASTTLTLSGVIEGDGGLEKRGAGALILSNANSTYVGDTILKAGTLSISDGNQVGNESGSVDFQGGTLIATAKCLLQRPIVLSQDATIRTNASVVFQLLGTVSGPGNLNKTGPGDLLLLTANTFTGNVNVQAGTLVAADDSVFGSSANTIRFSGSTLRPIGSFTMSRGWILSGDATVEVPRGTRFTQSGSIVGSGALIKTDLGRLVLTGTNSYSGNTTISAGFLETSADSLQGDVSNSGALVFNSTDTEAFSGIISGTGKLEKKGAGTLTLSGVNTYSGGTLLAKGALAISADANLGDASGDVIFVGGALQAQGTFSSSRNFTAKTDAILNVAAGENFTSLGVISGKRAVVKRGNGTLILGGINTYLGGTELSAGTIRVSANNNLGALQGALRFKGGTLATSATFSMQRDVKLTENGTFRPLSSTTLTQTGVVIGPGSLVKEGTGTLVLSGPNFYAGGTTLSAGTLAISANENLGKKGGTITFAGGTLQTTATLTMARNWQLDAEALVNTNTSTILTMKGNVTGSFGITKSGGGTLIFAGKNTYTGELTVLDGFVRGNASSLPAIGGSGGSLIFDQEEDGEHSKSFTGSGSLVKDGSARLILSGNNTYTGGTVINAGELQVTTSSLPGDVTNGAALTFDQDTAGTFTHQISGAGAVRKKGAGKVTLSGVNSFAGGVAVEDGTLSISSDQNLGDVSGSITFNGGELEATETISTSRSVILTGNGSVVSPNTKSLTLSGTVNGAGRLSKRGGGTLNLTGTNNYTGGTRLQAGTVTVSSDANLGSNAGAITFDGGSLHVTASFSSPKEVAIDSSGDIRTDGAVTLSLIGAISGSGALTKRGAGKLTLGGVSTYTGNVTISAGTVEATSLIVTGDVANEGTLIFNQTSAGEHSGAISGSGSLTKSGTGVVTLKGNNSYLGGTIISGGELKANLSSLPGNVVNQAALSLDVASDGSYGNAISGSGSFKKLGKGKLTLTANNSYTGSSTLSEGTVAISADGFLGNGGGLIFDEGTLETSQTIAMTRTVTLNGAAKLAPAANTSLTLQGGISGSGSLRHRGKGTLILTGSNSYAGGTVVEEGTLYASTTSLPGDATVDGALVFDQGSDGTFTGNLAGSGSMTKTNSGTLSLTGTNSFRGTTRILSGGLKGNSRSLSGNLINDAQLIFDQTEEGTFQDTISGSGNVSKQGSGKLILAGKNSYSGTTTVTSGELQVNTTSLPGSVQNNATLTFDQQEEGLFDHAVTGSGQMKKKGGGKLTLMSNSTQTLVTVEEGSLDVHANLVSDVNVSSGGILKGIGPIQGNILNSGIMAPGSSIGTTVVVGDYTQLTGSTLEIELNPSSVDLLDVTGAVTIQSGAALLVLPEIGHYTTGSRFQFIQTTGGVTGSFDILFQRLPALSFTVSYEGNDVFLVLQTNSLASLATEGLNPNAHQVALNLDALEAQGVLSGDLETVFGIIQTLPTVEQIANALDRLHPAAFYGFTVAQERLGVSLEEKIAHRMSLLSNDLCRCKLPKRQEVWIEGIYSQFDQKPKDFSPGYFGMAEGALVGIDFAGGETTLAGVTLGFTNFNAKLHENRGSSQALSGYLGLYGASLLGKLLIQGELIGSNSYFINERNIDFTLVHRVAESNYASYFLYSHLDLGCVIALDPVLITPFFKGSSGWGWEESFHEEKAIDLNLNVDSRTSLYIKTECGVRFSNCIWTEGLKRWEGNLKLSWIGEFFPLQDRYTASFSSYGRTFTVEGVQKRQNLTSFSIRSTHLLGSEWNSLSYGYEGEWGSDYQNHSVHLRFGICY